MPRELYVLSEILSVIEKFEKTHACRPAAVCLNTRHMLELMDEWADLFDGSRPLAQGVRFVVVAQHEAPRPRALPLPAAGRGRAATPPDADVLLAWSTGRQNLA